MARRLSVFSLAFVVLFFPLPTSASPTVCEDPGQWLAVFLPPEVLAVVCSIAEGFDPVGIDLDGEYPSAESQWNNDIEAPTQQPNPPEEAKQELLLWFLLWTQR